MTATREQEADRQVPTVSIVVPTFDRRSLLIRCLTQIRENVSTPKEIIVVDGGSTDGTREWLARQPADLPGRDELRVILEPRREGAVRAFNRGFRAAVGRYVMWLNDDARPLPGSVEAAIEMLERPDLADLGMVAFYHNWHSERNVLDRVQYNGTSFELCHVRGYPYANFGLLRRSLLQRVGFADERFYFFGFDPDLSLKIQLDEHLKVLGCRRALIEHDELTDDRKQRDLSGGRRDNELLFAKWKLPEPGGYPDPAPGYLKLLKERNLL